MNALTNAWDFLHNHWVVLSGGLGAVAAIATNIQKITDALQKITGRNKITAEIMVSSSPAAGNILTIGNLSDKQILISYWELLWIKRAPPWIIRTEALEEAPEPGGGGIKIPANDLKELVFENQNWFQTGPRMRAKGSLYLRLYFVGRKEPRYFRLYTPEA